MIYIVYTIHVVICIFLILVVLLQQGKGADLSVFGGGSTQTAFGARGAATLLHKLTVAGFIGFILTTMTIGFLQSGGTSGTVMGDVPEPAAVEETAPTESPFEPAAEEPAPEEAVAEETDAAGEATATEQERPGEAESEADDDGSPPG